MGEKHKEKGSMRDRHWDRESDKDKPEGKEPAPSGSLGPSGDVLDESQGQGGAMEPDPSEDIR
jgi:hypothetical protein